MANRFQWRRELVLYILLSTALASFICCEGNGKSSYNVGASAYNNKDYKEAIYHFTKALTYELTDKPSRGGVLLYRGLARIKTGNFQGALADCKEILTIDPNCNCEEVFKSLIAAEPTRVLLIGGVTPEYWPQVLRDERPPIAEDIPELITALDSEFEIIRARGAIALGQLGPSAKEALPALRKATSDSHGIVRSAAKEAIESIE